jgi:hypothetical protein
MSAAPCYLNKENSHNLALIPLLTQPRSHSRRSLYQDLHAPRPEESKLFHSSEELYPQSTRRSSPHVLSGDRTSRDREIHGAVPGRASPEIPMVKSQPRGTPLSPRALSYQFPECRNSDVPRARHLDPTMSPGSHSAPSPSGLLGSRNPRLQVLAAGNPECRIPDAPDSCHLSLQGLTAPIKSGGRPSRFRRACVSCTRQPRSADTR